jgi:hypothetical protein
MLRWYAIIFSRCRKPTPAGGAWEPGWRIVREEADGRIAVTKDAVTFWVDPARIRMSTGPVRAGSFCRVRIGKELRNLIPGFYMAIGDGDANDSRDGSHDLARIYWNLPAELAVPYMALVTNQLNTARVPFRTKVLSDPAAYGRADAAVLYFERRDFPVVAPVVRDIYHALGGLPGRSRPMFTLPLAGGPCIGGRSGEWTELWTVALPPRCGTSMKKGAEGLLRRSLSRPLRRRAGMRIDPIYGVGRHRIIGGMR